MKRFLRSCCTVLLIGVITVLLSEFVLRVYHYFNPVFIFPDNSYNRFRGKPYADDYDFRLNSRGLKDREFSKTKEQGSYRILGIGDSFAFGVVPYQYNFLTVLEDQLRSRIPSIEVINMGIPGLDVKDYLSVLVHEGLELNPDLVLLCFFVGNDLVQDKKAWYSYLYIVSIIKYVLDIQRHFSGSVIHGKAVYNDQQPTFSDEKYLEIERARSRVYRSNDHNLRNAFNDTMKYLRDIRDICSHRGVELAIVLIPDELQVNESLQAKVMTGLALTMEEWDFALPNKFLSEELGRLGIKHLDLLPSFSASGSELYRPQDSHWNIAGNQRAAQVIRAYLSETVLLHNIRHGS